MCGLHEALSLPVHRYKVEGVPFHRHVLPNGLTVLISANQHTPGQACGTIVVRTGSKHDPTGYSGLTHYMEHMMFKGTPQIGTTDYVTEKILLDSISFLFDLRRLARQEDQRQEIQQRINDLSERAARYAVPNELDGLLALIGEQDDNAYTGKDYVTFAGSMPPAHLRQWLSVYAQIFSEPVFRQFALEMDAVIEERNAATDDPEEVLDEWFDQYFYKDHPYSRSIFGYTQDLLNPSVREMYAYFERYYVPANMALVLTGDIDEEAVMAQVAATFGQIPARKSPEISPYTRYTALNGREFQTVRVPGLDLPTLILAYETLGAGHPDVVILDVLASLLRNEDRTGLLDEPRYGYWFQAAEVSMLSYQERGEAVFELKLANASPAEAEKEIEQVLARIQLGRFEEWRVEAARLRCLRRQLLSLEQNQSRAEQMAAAFAMGLEWDSYTQEYLRLLTKVTREDIQRVAAKYFKTNRLVLHAVPVPRSTRTPLPRFGTDIQFETKAHTAFYTRIQASLSNRQQMSLIDFEKDLYMARIAPDVTFYKVANPYPNDIFSLRVRFHAGELHIPRLSALVDLLRGEMAERNTELQKLGISYSFGLDKHSFYIDVTGFEQSLPKGIEELQKVLKGHFFEFKNYPIDPKFTRNWMKGILSDTDALSYALFDYAQFGPNSSYNMVSRQNMQADTRASLWKMCEDVLRYPISIHYTGKFPAAVVERVSREMLAFIPNRQPISPSAWRPAMQEYAQNTLLFFHRPGLTQTKVQLFVPGMPFDQEDYPYLLALNYYLGNQSSSLLFSELRTKRGLVYEIFTDYQFPTQAQERGYHYGYFSCQMDKTLEVLERFDRLIRELSGIDQDIESLRSAVLETIPRGRPDIRQLSMYVEQYQAQGYEEDPRPALLETLGRMTAQDLVRTHRRYWSIQPKVIMVVTDRNRIDPDRLSSWGQVREVRKEDIFFNEGK